MESKREHPLFFSSKVDTEEKNERLIQLMAAIREGGAKAAGSSINITYAKAFAFLKLVDPDLFEDVGKFFQSKRSIPLLVQRYRELAEASQPVITPEELIQKEIKEVKTVIKNAVGGKYKNLEKYERELLRAIHYLNSESGTKDLKEGQGLVAETNQKYLWETEAIERDYYTAKRDSDYYKEIPITDGGFREYSLPNDRLMRIRLLHNRAPEKIIGVDLIYEQVDIVNKRIRFIHLQYKMWDETRFHIKSGKETRQLGRLQEKLCNPKFCKKRGGSDEFSYRMPYCCAFYRPTHKRQSKNAQLITTGIHLPVCFVSGFKPRISISKEEVYNQGLSNNVFDELFRNGLIGSAWMNLDKAQKFYEENKIIQNPSAFVVNIRDEMGHNKTKLNLVERLRDLI